MFLSDLRGQQTLQVSPRDAACADGFSNPLRNCPDHRLITDCRSLAGKLNELLDGIEHAAECFGDEHARLQASMSEVNEQVLDLMGRVIVVRSSTLCGVHSKHAVANLLLANGWHDDPSPYRDAMLLSFVRDAGRLRYPNMPDATATARGHLKAVTAVITASNKCMDIIRQVAASFALKDQNSALNQADPDDLDATILGLMARMQSVIQSLIGLPARCAASLHAKRVVLRRMLEAGYGDAHGLRIQLARSYCDDLNALNQLNAQAHEPLSTYALIRNTLSSKLRWLTSAVQHR